MIGAISARKLTIKALYNRTRFLAKSIRGDSMKNEIARIKSRWNHGVWELSNKLSLLIASYKTLIYSRNWISSTVARQRRSFMKSLPREYKEPFIYRWSSIDNWWLSVLLALFVTLGIIVLGFGLAIVPNFSFPISSNEITSIASDIFQVSASLIGIVFVMVVFILQSANKDEYGNQVLQIFINETSILPWGLINLFSIIVFGLSRPIISFLGESNSFSTGILYSQILLFVIDVTSLTLLFIKILRMLPANKLIKYILKDARFRVTKIAENEMQRRLLQEQFTIEISKLECKYSVFEPIKTMGVKVSIDEEKDHNKRLLISDFNPRLVQNTIQIAKKHNCGYTPDQINILAIPGSVYSIGKALVIVSEANAQKLINLQLKMSFRLLERRKNVSEDLVSIIRNDVLIRATLNHDLAVFERYLEIIKLIFHDYCNIRNMASRFFHISDIDSGIFNINLISETLYTFYKVGPIIINSASREILDELIHLPFDIFDDAIENKDSELFRIGYLLFIFIYDESYKAEEVNGHHIREILYHGLVDLRRFSLKTKWNFDYTKTEIDFSQFLNQLLQIYSEILFRCINNNDSNYFHRFLLETGRLKADVRSMTNDMELKNLTATFPMVFFEDKDYPTSDHKISASTYLEVRSCYFSLHLGIGAWLYHLLSNNDSQSEQHAKMLREIELIFDKFDKLFLPYIDTINKRSLESCFDWFKWEASEWPGDYATGSGGMVKFNDYIDDFFILRSMEFNDFSDIDDQIETLPDLEFLLNKLKEKRNSFIDEPRFSSYCKMNQTTKQIVNLDLLINKITDLTIIQERRKLSVIRESSLDELKVNNFLSGFFNSVKQNSNLINYLIETSAIEQSMATNNSELNSDLFFQKKLPKEWFVKNREILTDQITPGCGEEASNSKLFRLLTTPTVKPKITEVENTDQFDLLIKQYQQNTSQLLVLIFGYDCFDFFNDHEIGKSYNPIKNALEGPDLVWQDIPCFFIDKDLMKSDILILLIHEFDNQEEKINIEGDRSSRYEITEEILPLDQEPKIIFKFFEPKLEINTNKVEVISIKLNKMDE